MKENIKKIIINEDKCIGCGSCGMTAPDAFGFDDSKGKATVKKGALDTNHEKVREVANNCPVQAITVEE